MHYRDVEERFVTVCRPAFWPCGPRFKDLMRKMNFQGGEFMPRERQSSGSLSSRAGLALRFNHPIIANGHVYVGAKREVDVYGLASQETARK